MYEVELINLKTRKRFVKEFKSLFLCKEYCDKCKYSKKVMVISHPDFSFM